MVTPSSRTDVGTPIFITLWDLLPASTVSSAAFRIAGLGVLHTNVWCPDLNTEWAFGGHDVPGYTGVFDLPTEHKAPSSGLSLLPSSEIPAPGPAPLPDARYKGAYFLGYAGAPLPEESGRKKGDSMAPSATGRWAAPQSGRDAFLELGVGQRKTQGWLGGLWSASSSSKDTSTADEKDTNDQQQHPRHGGVRARSLSYVLQTVSAFKKDPQWQGPAYDLLNRNCNHFSAALIEALTGATLPAFINRTASIGAAIVPLLPVSITGLAELDTSAHACSNADYDANSADGYEDDRPDTPRHDSSKKTIETDPAAHAQDGTPAHVSALSDAVEAETHAGRTALKQAVGSEHEQAETRAEKLKSAKETAKTMREAKAAKTKSKV